MYIKKNVGNTNFQKTANEILILDYLRRNSRVSRIELTRAIGLRQSTVTYIVNRLMKEGILLEASPKEQKKERGRRPIPVYLNGSFGHILGVDIGANEYRFCITDMTGTVKHQDSVPAADIRQSAGTGDLADCCHTCYGIIMARIRQMGFKILLLCLSVPGFVDPRTGFIIRSDTLNVESYGLQEPLERAIPIPILIEADANCGILTHTWEEQVSAADSFLYLLFRSSGTGEEMTSIRFRTALTANGGIYRGAHFFSGDVKDSVIPPSLEQSMLAYSRGKNDASGQELEKIIRELFVNLTVLLLNLDPSVICFGGDLFFHTPPKEEFLSEIMQRVYSKHPRLKECAVRISPDPCYDTAHGACLNGLSAVYTIPRIGEQKVCHNIGLDTILEPRRMDGQRI
ncbi:ROK family transcriptional regulator [Treponema sp. OttesenSCG-928-L16]|nr:ROK family transcriptional regulator [Treponema sp. OttesenSCG-928-L16]